MEFRKLIKFGNNSYVVSLPKNWIVHNKLDKGHTIYLQNNSNQLLLSPERITTEVEEKEITLDCRKDAVETIKRKIISHYINNYKIINVLYNTHDTGQEIRKIIQNLMALEVIEQGSNVIVAKDYLNVNNVSIPSLIRKNDNIIRTMFKDMNETLKQGNFFRNVELCDSFSIRDQDVNRITFLVMRSVKYVLSNPEMKAERSDFEYFNYYEMSQALEKLGDEIKRAMRLLAGVDLEKNAAVVQVFEEMERIYLDSMKGYYNKDAELAYKTAAEKNAIMEKLNDLMDKHRSQLHTITLIEKLKSIIITTHAITRLTYQ